MASLPSLRAQRLTAEQQWKRWIEHDPSVEIRTEVQDSWQRSSSAVSLDVDAAPTETEFNVELAWKEHVLRDPVSTLAPDLQQVAEDGGFVVAITNPESTILWTTGSTQKDCHSSR